MPENVIPTNGMTITEDTTFAAGVFHLPDGVRIVGDGITVQGDGTTLISDEQVGSGIHILGGTQITLQNLTISGFYHGVRAEQCAKLRIADLTVRNTQEIAGIDTFLDLWKPIEAAYGGAIRLHQVSDSRIEGCDLQHQMHGLLLYGCAHITVAHNNASFNSGWGLYLSDTHDSTVQANRFDFCNRVFRRPENGSIRVEADAAGMVIVNGSSRNRFVRNSCLCGGDGIFLCGYEHPGKLRPCNDNHFEENDCRLSPNNAIEATFSANNTFINNDCSRSNYGLWMGYSHDCTLENNLVAFSRWVGIAIEHGYNIAIRRNTLHNNGEGVRLFTRGGESVLMDYYAAQKVPYDFIIEDNDFAHNTIGFNGYTGDDVKDKRSRGFVVRGNRFTDNRVGARFHRVEKSVLASNRFAGNVVEAIQIGAEDEVAQADNEIT